MPIRRREPENERTALPAATREPRLVLRFAVVTAIGLALAGALILAVVREIDQRQAVRAASDRAQFVSETFLQDVLRTDRRCRSGSRSARRKQLDSLMQRHVLIDGALRVSIVGPRQPDHVFDRPPADRHRRRQPRRDLAEARSGDESSRASQTVPAVQGDGHGEGARRERSGRARARTPSRSSRSSRTTGPSPPRRESRCCRSQVCSSWRSLVLFVLLVPALARASRRLRRYVARSATRPRTTPSPACRTARRCTRTSPRRCASSRDGRARRRPADRSRPLQGGERLARARRGRRALRDIAQQARRGRRRSAGLPARR